jgi:hypothetical protein
VLLRRSNQFSFLRNACGGKEIARRMLDRDQQRFASRCTDAALGYSAASTAAYAAFADQVLNFWSSVLQPPTAKPQPSSQLWSWPVPMAPPAPPSPQFNPFNPFDWMLPAPPPKPPAPTLPTNPWEAMSAFANAMSGALSAMSATPVRPLAPATNPMAAWLTTMPFASAPASWPMAFMMMSSGVPHTVAWPTAEANAAVLDAADAATQSIKKVFASYQSEGGHASSHGTWPPTEMLTLMAMVPLNVGTMFAALRMP